MGRAYVELGCGCLASCDGGGGLIPCESEACQFRAWADAHPFCDWCGECLTCWPEAHARCRKMLRRQQHPLRRLLRTLGFTRRFAHTSLSEAHD